MHYETLLILFCTIFVQIHYTLKLHKFENQVLRKIYGTKKKKEKFRILHNKELLDLYRPLSIVRIVKFRMGWSCGYDVSDKECSTESWWENLLQNVHFGRLKRRWEDKVTMDFRNIGCGDRHGQNYFWLLSNGSISSIKYFTVFLSYSLHPTGAYSNICVYVFSLK